MQRRDFLQRIVLTGPLGAIVACPLLSGSKERSPAAKVPFTPEHIAALRDWNARISACKRDFQKFTDAASESADIVSTYGRWLREHRDDKFNDKLISGTGVDEPRGLLGAH